MSPSSPASVLRDAFARHTWATLALLDHLEAVGADVVTREVPGTYGRIDETLMHLVAADTRYLDRLDDPDLPPMAPRAPAPIPALRAEVEGNVGRWAAALDRLEAGTLHASIGANAAHPGIEPAETLLVLQALHHADDHRAQICSTLGALGLDVPYLDVWSFWEHERENAPG